MLDQRHTPCIDADTPLRPGARRLKAGLLAAVLVLANLPVAWSQQGGGGTPGNGPLPMPQLLPPPPLSALSEPKQTYAPPRIERRVESTELGYDQSVAPGPGRTVTFQGRQYQVAEVEVLGGGPLLFFNHYVIGPEGSRLIVSLREPDAFDGLTN